MISIEVSKPSSERSNRSVGNRYQPRRGQDLWPQLDMHRRNRDAQETININMAQHRNNSVSPYSAFAHRLRQVTWPDKFRPRPIEKYDGTTNPKEWIQIYEMVIETASGDDYVKANFLPIVLQGSAQT